METGDVVAIVAATVSAVALVVSLINRKQDIAREEAFRIRSRVWEILSNEPGLRSVEALDKEDGATEKRLELLARTAMQLKVAGAEDLGASLELVLRQAWPAPNEVALATREKFLRLAANFMRPER